MTLFYLSEIDDVGGRGTIFSPWRAFSYSQTPHFHRYCAEDMIAANTIEWLNEMNIPYIVHATQFSTQWRSEDSSLVAYWTTFIEIMDEAQAVLFRMNFPNMEIVDHDEVCWGDLTI